MKWKIEGVQKLWDRYKFAALVVLIGAALLLWPSGTPAGNPAEPEPEPVGTGNMQAELEEILGTIQGVGRVRVMLTVDSGGERQLAQDTELSYRGETAAPEDYSRRSEIVLVDAGSSDQVVVVRQGYPTYRGALVVCQGGDQPAVQLAVTEAVASLTGLTADRIAVAKWQLSSGGGEEP